MWTHSTGLRTLTAGLTFALLASSAEAAVRTWTGAASALWSDAGNWGGTAPVAGDDLVFPVGALNGTNVNDLPADTLFNSITSPDRDVLTRLHGDGNAILAGARRPDHRRRRDAGSANHAGGRSNVVDDLRRRVVGPHGRVFISAAGR